MGRNGRRCSLLSGLCLKGYVAGALYALLILSGASKPASAADAKSTTAILLVAGDELSDPSFAGSIVLVLNNLGPGPVGFILNRPMAVPVSRLFPDLKRLAQVNEKLYFGGPVEFGSVWFLFRARTSPEHAVQVSDGVYVSADRGLLRQLLSRDEPMNGLRIVTGYAGWEPDQLRAEIASGAWTVKRADAEAIFNSKPEHPWPSPPQAPKNRT